MNIPIMDLKKKMESLLGSYRRERSREKKSRITGSGRGDIYKSNWYAYEAFSFLGDRNHPGNTQDTLPEDNACHSEIQNDGSQSKTRNDGSENETQNSGSQSETQNQVGNENTVKETRNEYTRAKKRTKRTEPNDLTDNAISEALTLLQQCASDSAASEKHDSYDVYGQYVANELRKYDAFTLAHVKHAINKIFFEADMGAYPSYTASVWLGFAARGSLMCIKLQNEAASRGKRCEANVRGCLAKLLAQSVRGHLIISCFLESYVFHGSGPFGYKVRSTLSAFREQYYGERRALLIAVRSTRSAFREQHYGERQAVLIAVRSTRSAFREQHYGERRALLNADNETIIVYKNEHQRHSATEAPASLTEVPEPTKMR
ncbi:uncharacterized protein LOC128199936 [Bicyclus anynana]|uniref:Uncharacterized protein LOC128199936 n=1 Tax=Bicyclus anynana TaxID=110368 RepID=A0ABM3M8T8_BICAN|nr:uncharacterized protein LOC128199936 [Bicyclus anynana]